MTPNFASLLTSVHDMGLFSATCTIQRFDGTVGTTGRPAREVDANWDDLAGHIDIECMAAHDIMMTNVSKSKEMKSALALADSTEQHILLNGHFPLIQQDDRIILTKGALTQTLDITGVEDDSQSTMTRLAAKLVRL